MAGRTDNQEGYRFGFNGQERDDDVSGVGNTNTAEHWEYDTRIGRRWNIDPVIKVWESPYACFANNPINFIDVAGADTGDVVVAFGGADFMGTDAKGSAEPLINLVNMNKSGGKAESFSSQYWGTDPEDKKSLDDAVLPAYNFIKNNYNRDEDGNNVKNGRIVIYGYSFGGVLATHLADKLNDEGIEVKVLFTIDASAGAMENDEVDRSISPNVKLNVNYYQTNPSGPLGMFPGSRGDRNTAENPSSTSIYNCNLTPTMAKHSDIDEKTFKFVLNLIKAALPDVKNK